MSSTPRTSQRPAIDYVSPLPPVRSGIADYSRDLLPHLEPLCDLRVVRLPDQPVSEEVESRFELLPAAEAGAGGRLPLYHMGNNRHHEGVLVLALERPGVVALHDLVLHHLLVETTLGKGELEPYLERLEADHGWVGAVAARARRWGELGQSAMFELSAHRTLLRRQRGVLVHSRWAAEVLAEEDPELAVRVVPMAMPLPERPDPQLGRRFREQLGIGERTPLLGSFGFQTPIKRTERVVAALARPELAEAHLVVAGEVSPVLDLEEVARRAGATDRLHVTGFLDYETFEAAIAACDLCVNLRYPTAGETSASLLRVLAVGGPALVSDYAQFSELPDDVVAKVPLGDGEEEALALRAAALLADPEARRRMADRARRHVRARHDPDVAAAAMVAACGELGLLEPPGDRAVELEPPSTLTWRELPGELSVGGLEEEWPVGAARTLEIALRNHGPARWLATREGTGGVLVEAQWRREVYGETLERSWVPLPTDLGAGRERRLEMRLRRPPEGKVLIIEPHVKGVAGFNALGGPRAVHDLASGHLLENV